MATIRRFEEFVFWQKARILNKEIYTILNTESIAKDYRLKDQMNGASGSIMDNIAEGFERDGRSELKLFLSYAKGSCGELQSQLYRALDRNYITNEVFEKLYDETSQIGKMIGGFMNYLKVTEYKGNKFKDSKALRS